MAFFKISGCDMTARCKNPSLPFKAARACHHFWVLLFVTESKRGNVRLKFSNGAASLVN